ncbi:MAG: enoyl-CoA hydratase [Acidimicrobiales bacterium]|nr:enoyl-CoA hydratase [Acidimicrobiales bacterium]
MSVTLTSIDGPVATLTLNRPEARNALNTELLGALAAGMATLDADPEVAAIVLTGADPAFCAGLDLKALAEGSQAVGGTRDAATPGAPFAPTSKPVIGAINGPAVTGGFEIALHCDFLIASEQASFADTHARVGIMPGWGLSVRLPLAVGYARAKQISLTGNFVDAATALRWGLVNEVVPHADVVTRAQQLGADIASVPAAARIRYRQLYDEHADLRAALLHEGQVSAAFTFDRDALAASREAIQARGRTQSSSDRV